MDSFLDLPVELQICIISTLDGRTILECRKASHTLKHLIDTSIELQYTLELTLAGMVDGRPGGPSTRERLDALRAYRAAWQSGVHPVQRIHLSPHGGQPPSSLGPHAAFVAYPDVGTGRLKVHRPSTLFCGVGERTDEFPGWTKEVASKPHKYASTVVPERDLMVCSWKAPESEGIPWPADVVYDWMSLSNGFTPHPMSCITSFTSCKRSLSNRTHTDMQSLGDLMVLSQSEDAVLDMIVINTSTGIVVWHMHAEGHKHIRLISATHLVLINSDDLLLHIHSLDPDAPEDCAPMLQNEPLCTLQFPPCTERVVRQDIASRLEPPPAFPEDACPLFQRDPCLSVLVLEIKLGFPIGHVAALDGEDFQEVFILFVPLSTLESIVAAEKATDTHNSGAEDEATTATERRGRAIPWEEWGPRGTRMIQELHFGPFPSVLGAQAAITEWRWPWSSEPRTCLVSVYEALPLVNVAPGQRRDVPDRSRREEESGSSLETVLKDQEWIRKSEAWKGEVHTSYPLRKTTRVIQLEEGEDEGRCVVLLSYDGLVLVKCVRAED